MAVVVSTLQFASKTSASAPFKSVMEQEIFFSLYFASLTVYVYPEKDDCE